MPAPTQVGLGSARTYASGPAMNAYQAKVPMGLRALASLISEGDNARELPQPKLYRPYRRPRQRRLTNSKRIRRSVSRQSHYSIDSTAISTASGISWSSNTSRASELRRYFPLPRRSTPTLNLAPLPEDLVTPGRVTVLTLPLAWDYDRIFNPTPRNTYPDTAIGLAVLADLLRPIPDIYEYLMRNQSLRIFPLIAKLESLGVFNRDMHPAVAHEVEYNAMDEAQSMRFVFYERSIADVQALLGESLRQGEEDVWWTLDEADGTDVDHQLEALQQVRPFADLGLSCGDFTPGERSEMAEHWADVQAMPFPTSIGPGAAIVEPEMELRFPRLDTAIHHAHTSPARPLDVEDMADAEEIQEWQDQSASGIISPNTSFGSDHLSESGSDFDTGSIFSSSSSSDQGSFDRSFDASSFISQLSDSSSHGSGSVHGEEWAVEPSEADSEIARMWSSASDVAARGVSRVRNVLAARSLEESAVAEELGSWNGTGEGFGMAQNWCAV